MMSGLLLDSYSSLLVRLEGIEPPALRSGAARSVR
jgi:hypothetical protein